MDGCGFPFQQSLQMFSWHNRPLRAENKISAKECDWNKEALLF